MSSMSEVYGRDLGRHGGLDTAFTGARFRGCFPSQEQYSVSFVGHTGSRLVISGW